MGRATTISERFMDYDNDANERLTRILRPRVMFNFSTATQESSRRQWRTKFCVGPPHRALDDPDQSTGMWGSKEATMKHSMEEGHDDDAWTAAAADDNVHVYHW
jgi:hypothetical protein